MQIVDLGFEIWESIDHRAWGMEKEARDQTPGVGGQKKTKN